MTHVSLEKRWKLFWATLSLIRVIVLQFSTKVLTKLLTINSAREKDSLQAPPIRNEMFLPMMVNGGEVRVPWGSSPWRRPGGVSSEGRSSNPPIHQSPCWLAGELNPRAVGLSPYVGWLLNAVPVFCHPLIPSSKSNLQTSRKNLKFSTAWSVYIQYHHE